VRHKNVMQFGNASQNEAMLQTGGDGGLLPDPTNFVRLASLIGKELLFTFR